MCGVVVDLAEGVGAVADVGVLVDELGLWDEVEFVAGGFVFVEFEDIAGFCGSSDAPAIGVEFLSACGLREDVLMPVELEDEVGVPSVGVAACPVAAEAEGVHVDATSEGSVGLLDGAS